MNILFISHNEPDIVRMYNMLQKQINGNHINISFNIKHSLCFKLLGMDYIKTNNFSFKNKVKILETKYSMEEIVDASKYGTKLSKYFFNNEMAIISINYVKNVLGSLESIYDKEKIDMIIAWNTVSYPGKIAKLFALKNNIKIFHLEEGYFRPNTLTFDLKGVNYENSIIRDSKYYKDIEIKKTEKFEKREIFCFNEEIKKDKSYRNRVLFYYIFNKILNPFELSKFIIEKYVFIKNKKYKYGLDNINFRYIFVPFQVETDTQTMMFSNISGMKQLVEVVLKALDKYNSKNNDNIKVIFKIHPKDKYLKLYKISSLILNNPNSFLLTEGDTNELIKNSLAVITINSTVGIEALSLGKKVITLGDAFYNIDGIVKHCTDFDNLHNDIKEVLNNSLDIDLINKFLYYLRYKYFKQIVWRDPKEEEIDKLVKEILEYNKSSCGENDE